MNSGSFFRAKRKHFLRSFALLLPVSEFSHHAGNVKPAFNNSLLVTHRFEPFYSFLETLKCLAVLTKLFEMLTFLDQQPASLLS